ncbi:MAG: FAD-binding oxidoreductase [Proteobacteria bacterium]|nr:FAD-binding oxidoreductase [Pseudomonadota bacterium]
MAKRRIAHIVAEHYATARARLLELATQEGEPLGFTGGQYIIIDSGIEVADGKKVKRAYSVITSDTEQNCFQLAIRRIGGGLGSNFMNDIAVGTELAFSGPWGKWRPDATGRAGETKADGVPKADGTPADGTETPATAVGPVAGTNRVDTGATVVLATDTGITAALGLLRGGQFRDRLSLTTVVWCVDSDDYFLPPGLVRDLIPAGCDSFQIRFLPPVGHPDRVVAARSILADILARTRYRDAYLVGDGTVLLPLAQDLGDAGMAGHRIRVEYFFNRPPKKS